MCTVHFRYDSALWRWHICPFRLLDPVQTETKSFVRTTTDFMSFNNYICSGIKLTCVGLFSLFYLTVLFNEKITILFADQFHRLWIFIPYKLGWFVCLNSVYTIFHFKFIILFIFTQFNAVDFSPSLFHSISFHWKFQWKTKAWPRLFAIVFFFSSFISRT